MADALTLGRALQVGRLPEIIAQEESRGIRPVDARVLDRALRQTIKAPQSADQTSRSPSDDGLPINDLRKITVHVL